MCVCVCLCVPRCECPTRYKTTVRNENRKWRIQLINLLCIINYCVTMGILSGEKRYAARGGVNRETDFIISIFLGALELVPMPRTDPSIHSSPNCCQMGTNKGQTKLRWNFLYSILHHRPNIHFRWAQELNQNARENEGLFRSLNGIYHQRTL